MIRNWDFQLCRKGTSRTTELNSINLKGIKEVINSHIVILGGPGFRAALALDTAQQEGPWIWAPHFSRVPLGLALFQLFSSSPDEKTLKWRGHVHQEPNPFHNFWNIVQELRIPEYIPRQLWAYFHIVGLGGTSSPDLASQRELHDYLCTLGLRSAQRAAVWRRIQTETELGGWGVHTETHSLYGMEPGVGRKDI